MAKGSSVILAVTAALLFSLMNQATCGKLKLEYILATDGLNYRADCGKASLNELTVELTLKRSQTITTGAGDLRGSVPRLLTDESEKMALSVTCKVIRTGRRRYKPEVTLTLSNESDPVHVAPLGKIDEVSGMKFLLGMQFLNPSTGMLEFTVREYRYEDNYDTFHIQPTTVGITNKGSTFAFKMSDGEWRVCIRRNEDSMGVVKIPTSPYGICKIKRPKRAKVVIEQMWEFTTEGQSYQALPMFIE